MPELPEVETIRKGLASCLPGKRIEKVTVKREKTVQGVTAKQFSNRLRGARFLHLDRHGKFLLLDMDSGDTIIVDLRMTGQLVYEPVESPPPIHTHVLFRLSDGGRLRFTDSRTFGSLKLIPTERCREHPSLRRLGPDGLSEKVTLQFLQKQLTSTHRPMKLFLLDQQRIAGIGNIYACEILFEAGIHPELPSDSVAPDQVRKLKAAIRKILNRAIKLCGTTMRDFRTGTGGYGGYQNEFRVYGREGKPCPRCQTSIVKTRLGNRGTYFCPRCQPQQP
ncbi:MAG: bifunctional DNA-formamidopyrimidine glycosylase/DNA-(apurinic or apyrimidinic site) lyase [Armatimonadetes bacterium]|nr:bifunctional DNA-formamidopyrimidine glycosylase/DNA-(apurinic or apyrimidinic site) lyase [Armatimonadota bacterium]